MRPWRKQMQVVFQDPYGSLSPRMSVQQIISEGLEVHAPCSPGRPRSASGPGAQGRGPGPRQPSLPHEFSGGQRQRIAIARALVLKPALMLLDEPTSALDRTVQKQVVALLRELQDKYGLTYLFISHDLAVVRAMAHDMIVVKDGKVVERGASHDVFESPQHPYTKNCWLQRTSRYKREHAFPSVGAGLLAKAAGQVVYPALAYRIREQAPSPGSHSPQFLR